MSLFDDGMRNMPEIGAYERRSLIPEEDWCKSCEGLGTVRWRHSMPGHKDWRICFGCHGSGKKDKSCSSSSNTSTKP